MPKKPWGSPRADRPHSLIVACFGLGTADGTALDPRSPWTWLVVCPERPTAGSPRRTVRRHRTLQCDGHDVLVTPGEGRIGAAPCITTPPDMSGALCQNRFKTRPWLRIPRIPATQSMGRLPLNPREACHPVHGKPATQSTARLPPTPGEACHRRSAATLGGIFLV